MYKETKRRQGTANANSTQKKKKIEKNAESGLWDKEEMAWKKTEENMCGAWKVMEGLN